MQLRNNTAHFIFHPQSQTKYFIIIVDLPEFLLNDGEFDNRQRYLGFHVFLGRKIPSKKLVHFVM